MTSLISRLSGAAASAILVATLCASVHASDDLIITTAGTNLDGDQLKNEVQISAKLGVSAYDGTNHGWLHIRANSITIDASGSIDATGAGYRGNGTGGAEGQPGAVGGTAPPGTPAPGGGGAHLGAGANGQDGTCNPFIGAEGGSPYDSPDAPLAEGTEPHLGMGSAGGASHALPPNDSHDGAGANGGGVIILEAELIHIDGELHADGDPGADPLDAAPGAGAGGTIIIRAHRLELGPTAKLSAIGGGSATASNPQNQFIYGGGGGGGLIVVHADILTGDALAISSVNGGGDNTGGCVGNTTGAPGVAVQKLGTGCVDADGDGHDSDRCGGDDCDDGDVTSYAGAKESCDDTDHNCDDDPVDNPDTLCPAGSGEVCDVDQRQCVPAGSGGGGQGGAEQGSTVELGGGLCTARRARPQGRHLGPWLLGLLGLAALGRRRGRR